ncbi:MAG: biotin--[acetyl-CoA-carboxylase] ligase [Flavobacteriaceae bacterium]|nr:biotin--[acetyl-CoA-carboxylase] ligase [Flavobacteriaceae bacterium]
MDIIKLDAIDSTNTYLKSLQESEGLDRDVVVWAHRQTAGRGQRGSTWVSDAGKNLTFSVLKVFGGLKVIDYFYLNMIVALAVCDVLASKEVQNVSIKWPNDILAGNRKICGILVENTIQSPFIQSSVIGIGLNVNQDVFEGLKGVSSLYLETGKNFDLEDLLQELLSQLHRRMYGIYYHRFLDIKEDYLSLLYGLGKSLHFEDKDGSYFEARVADVKKDGRLCLVLQSGAHRYVDFKEIKWLLDSL